MADIDVEPIPAQIEDGHAFSDAELERRGQLALADRRRRGEFMTYDLNGWVVREFPGMRIVRLCRSEDVRVEDHPYPA